MSMKITKNEIVNFLLVAAIFAAAAIIYPHLPLQVASHWGVNGEVDGYLDPFWGAFLVPLIALGIVIIFPVAVRIDPKRVNLEKFRKSFDLFATVMLLFLSYVYALTLSWTFGYRFNMGQMMIPGIAVLYLAIGLLIKNAEPNWSIGIRTPWTLSSENVWRKTHLWAAQLYIAAAAVCLIGLLFPKLAFWFVVTPVVVASLIAVVYSYLSYRTETMMKK